MKVAMPTTSKPDTVLETILKWSLKRPLWQRDALRRIIADGTPDEDGLNELLALCKKEHGDSSVELEPTVLSADHLPVDPDASEPVKIGGLSKVVGVNQLAKDQDLEFEMDGLTVVYGPNGTGKSGYSRILKKACRSRHAGEIMPDVYRPSATGNATALLSVASGSNPATGFEWEDNGSSPELLSAITVFDRDCASVHVQKKNEVWFRPFGLDIPDDLAGVCQYLKKAMTAERAALELQRNPVFQKPTWRTRSGIGKVMSSLKPDTDLSAFISKPAINKDEQTRMEKLRVDLAQDGSVAAAAQQQHAKRLDQMVSYFKQVESVCSNDALEAVFALKASAVAARKAADVAASKAFGGSAIDGVGHTSWKALWESARRYAKTVGDEGISFPPIAGDFCSLCHQPIDQESALRMSGFEDFIKKDTETAAVNAEHALKRGIEKVAGVNVHLKNVAVSYEYLKQNEPKMAKAVLKYLARAKLRQTQTLKQIANGEVLNLATLPINPVAEVETLANTVKTYAASLTACGPNDSREKLLDELAELEDHLQLDNLILFANDEVTRLVKIDRLDKCIAETATTAITKLGNQIADDLITPLMRDHFRNEISTLAGNRVRVEIVRSGGKFGSPQYEVRLYANAKAKVHDVLSEGEQTCVALAAYLTELANASHASALVFDDPVTSLDHRWRNKVAKRLVKEAMVRQIVVFTHDLIFVNDLNQMAINQSIPIRLSHLSRGEQGVGIVNDDLPWRASGVRDRIDKLEKEARDAQKLYDAGNDEDYRLATHRIYDRLRAAWERALEDIVFAGVILRHRDYINTKDLNRVTALDSSDVATFKSGFKKCCDYVEAHDASRGRDSEPPDPTEVMTDIQSLNTWSTALRLKMNAVRS